MTLAIHTHSRTFSEPMLMTLSVAVRIPTHFNDTHGRNRQAHKVHFALYPLTALSALCFVSH